MINIVNLHAEVEEKKILKGLNLNVKAGEIHAIMGPNGSGKSTLASILAGKEDYTVTEGNVEFDGKDLLELSTEDRARQGLFLAFQYPIEIPGVSNVNFLKSALNEIREYRGEEQISAKDFLKLANSILKGDNAGKQAIQRMVNEIIADLKKQDLEQALGSSNDGDDDDIDDVDLSSLGL